MRKSASGRPPHNPNQPMKRLLNYSRRHNTGASANSGSQIINNAQKRHSQTDRESGGVVQIITSNSGFVGRSSSNNSTAGNNTQDQRNIMTQMQIYNRMQ